MLDVTDHQTKAQNHKDLFFFKKSQKKTKTKKENNLSLKAHRKLSQTHHITNHLKINALR